MDIDRIREETPGTRNAVHLNAAGSALPARPVLDAVVSHLELEAEIGGYEAADRAHGRLEEGYAVLARLVGAAPDERRFKIYRTGEPVSLSAVLPVLQRLGVEVVDERPYELRRADRSTAWIYDFGLRMPSARVQELSIEPVGDAVPGVPRAGTFVLAKG